MLNTERRNRRGNREIRFEVNSNYYKAVSKLLSDYKRALKENEELKNNIRKNENELEFDVNCDWITLQKILDESEKSNEYILYKNEKWIKEKYCIPVQKVKDKIEEILNNGEYTIIFEGDADFADEATRIDAQKYIKLEKLQELLESEE